MKLRFTSRGCKLNELNLIYHLIIYLFIMSLSCCSISLCLVNSKRDKKIAKETVYQGTLFYGCINILGYKSYLVEAVLPKSHKDVTV